MKLLTGSVIAVGGGKGGVGKSFFASNLACCLAKSGRKVVLIDADLAGANIHILFGIKYPERTLSDYLQKKVAGFSDVLLPTMLPNLRLICGAADLLEIANPHYARKQKLIADIGRLDAECIIIDIGAGASLNNLDFFNAADTGVLVTTPTPTSLQNAYGFLKMAVQRKVLTLFSGDAAVKKSLEAAFGSPEVYKSMKDVTDMVRQSDSGGAARIDALLSESSFRLAVNMATYGEEQRVAKALGGVAYQYLNLTLASIGAIAFDADVENSIRKMEPLFLRENPAMTRIFAQMAGKLFKSGDAPPPERPASLQSSSRVQLCLHDEALFRGVKLHVQTEDLGLDRAQIVSLVFSGGRILYSRKTAYQETLGRSDVQHAVTELVKAAHRRILNDIAGNALADELSKGLVH